MRGHRRELGEFFHGLDRIRAAVFALVLLGLVLCLGCEPGAKPPAGPPPVPGVSEDTVRIGSSLALSGHAEYLGIQTLRGALCYIKYINEQGGVHGRRIEVVAHDDQYDPARCLINTQRLLIEEDVFSLFSYVGTPTTVKILPLVEQAGIPLVGMFTGANALREPFNPWVINVRASYYQETQAAVRHLVEDLGLTRIGVFYQYDAYGFDGLTGTELALKSYGLTPVARGAYIRGSMDIEEGLAKIRDARAQAVVMIGTYDPCAKFIRESRAQGFDPLFYNVSFVGAEELARRLYGEPDATVVLSQVVPPPESLPSANGEPGYIELLSRYYPDESPNFIGLEGFLNARILVEGLRRAGRPLTRQTFLRAIESIRDYAVAPSLRVSFGPDDHQGLDSVYFVLLERGDFRPITDWNMLRPRLAKRGQP